MPNKQTELNLDKGGKRVKKLEPINPPLLIPEKKTEKPEPSYMLSYNIGRESYLISYEGVRLFLNLLPIKTIMEASNLLKTKGVDFETVIIKPSAILGLSKEVNLNQLELKLLFDSK